MTRCIILISIIPLIFAACSKPKDLSQLVEVGQTKEEIKKVIGNPYKIESFQKKNEYVWGPEEDFWPEIPEGTRLEVWRYKNELGHLNLYFVENDTTLTYIAFAPEGVQYESKNDEPPAE